MLACISCVSPCFGLDTGRVAAMYLVLILSKASVHVNERFYAAHILIVLMLSEVQLTALQPASSRVPAVSYCVP